MQEIQETIHPLSVMFLEQRNWERENGVSVYMKGKYVPQI